MTTAVSLVHVSVALSARPVVRDVSATIAAGSLVALVGPNGAGKTTLARAISGLVAPSAGEVRVQGRAPHREDRRWVATALAYVPQRYELGFPFAVGEVVMLGRHAHRRGVGADAPADIARSHAAMREFDVLALADRRFDELSGGEQRRVLLAQAWCQEAGVVVLDEPTAALDPAHARDVFARLHTLTQAGKAALVVTHDLNLAARFADVLWVMHEGALIAEGAVAEVLAGGAIERAFAVRLHRGEHEGVRFVVTL